MRITSGNMCMECCYCIEDYDNYGLCCKDNIYKPVKLNKSACRYFCGDNDDDIYKFDSMKNENNSDILFDYED